MFSLRSNKSDLTDTTRKGWFLDKFLKGDNCGLI